MLRRGFLLSVTAATALGVGCQGSDESSKTERTGDAGETATNVTSTETGESPDPAFVVSGNGPTERSIDVPDDYVPFIFSARYPKGSFLTVGLRGDGLRRVKGFRGSFLFDGRETSVTATPGIASGTYRLTVNGTKGSWSLQFQEPDARVVSPVPLFREVIGGRGDDVVPVQIAEETAVRWQMQTDGLSVMAELLGFGAAEGAEQFLGILQGEFAFGPGKRGFRSDSALPAGDYLLVVDADGRWAVQFKPINEP